MKKTSNIVIFTLLLVSSLTIMVGAAIAPALSGIVNHLNFSYPPSLLITLPSLGVVISAPFAGKLLDKLGAFKLLYCGLIPYAILGLAGAFIHNDYILIADRFLLGAAAVAVQIAGTAFIADLFTSNMRMKVIAWQGMAVEFGGVVFLAIGGIVGEINSQFPFYIYLVALICLALVIKYLPREKSQQQLSQQVINDKIENPFKVKMIFTASLLAMMLFFVGFITFPLYIPKQYGFDESQIGYLLASISVVAIITASQMPRVVNAIGEGKTIVTGFLFFMFGYAVVAAFTGFVFLVLTTIFIGVGFGFTIPLLNHMMVEVSTAKSQGKNLGLFSMGVFGGQFLSTFIEYISNDYSALYAFAAAIALTVGVLLYFTFDRKPEN